jgi:putative nucleotidyltransferase with HDIG domain
MSAIQAGSIRTSESVTESGTIRSRGPLEYRERLSVTLIKTIGLRDPYLLDHSERVAELAMKLARRLGLSEAQVELVQAASIFHDIGKLGISQELLSKPAPLTPGEYKIIKTHAELGAALLHECPDYRAVIPVVRHHHEYFNGKGYPDQLAGEQIEIEARIIAVADTIDVMRSERPYHAAHSVRQISKELRRCANVQFDPRVVEAAVELLREI